MAKIILMKLKSIKVKMLPKFVISFALKKGQNNLHENPSHCKTLTLLRYFMAFTSHVKWGLPTANTI